MKNNRALPMPFLILILAGVVSLFSLLADPSSRVRGADDVSLPVQAGKQERAAAVYFRVLSWLSEVAAPVIDPPVNDPQPAALAPRAVKARREPAHPGKIQLCSFHVAQAAAKRRRQTLN